MSEIRTNDLKKKVEKIRNDRKNTIKEIVDLLYSDVSLLTNRKIKDSFKKWLVRNKIFTQYSSITKRRRKIYRKETPEYLILTCLKFDKNYYIAFNGDYHEKCPYTQDSYFFLSELNGKIWLKYELIFNKIKRAIPQYLEHFYKAELLRLCDKKFTQICEECGTKNEKCAIYCNICGTKLEYVFIVDKYKTG